MTPDGADGKPRPLWYVALSAPFFVLVSVPRHPPPAFQVPTPHCSCYHCLQGALNWGHNLRGNKETNNRFLKAGRTSLGLLMASELPEGQRNPGRSERNVRTCPGCFLLGENFLELLANDTGLQ